MGNPEASNNAQIENSDDVERAIALNSEFEKFAKGEIGEKELQVALSQYKKKCETMDEETLQNEAKSNLNSIDFYVRRAGTTEEGNDYLKYAARSLKIRRAKLAIVRDMYVKQFHMAARGGIAPQRGLISKIHQLQFREPFFDDRMQRHQYSTDSDFPEELRLNLAALRVVDEALLELSGRESNDKLYTLLNSKELNLRQIDIVKEKLAENEGFDILPTSSLQQKMNSLNAGQKQVAQYVIDVMRKKHQGW